MLSCCHVKSKFIHNREMESEVRYTETFYFIFIYMCTCNMYMYVCGGEKDTDQRRVYDSLELGFQAASCKPSDMGAGSELWSY